jgi:hypothetical protein
MKVKVTTTKRKALPYPKLMTEGEGLIVLMYCDGKGTVVNGSFAYTTGYHLDNWRMEAFKDFEGEVLLSNN